MRITMPLAGLTLTMLLAACGSNTADLYQAPPADGSVAANSADVVDNPAIVPSSGSDTPRRTAEGADRTAARLARGGANETEVVDPITQEPVDGSGHIGYFGQWQVRFNSAASAAQFAALPRAKRAALAAAQVLPKKGIHNSICPVTGETLTALAAPVTWDGTVIGFASMADANQFRAFTKEKQAAVIAAWTNAGAK
jgi:hypothetical protein